MSWESALPGGSAAAGFTNVGVGPWNQTFGLRQGAMFI